MSEEEPNGPSTASSSDRPSSRLKETQQGLVVSVSVRPPGTSADGAITDDELFDDRKEIDSALALIQEENSKAVDEAPESAVTAGDEEPSRSDSAITIQLDAAECSGNQSRDDLESVDPTPPSKATHQQDVDEDPPPELNSPQNSPQKEKPGICPFYCAHRSI